MSVGQTERERDGDTGVMSSKERGGGYSQSIGSVWLEFKAYVSIVYISTMCVCVCVPLSPGFTVCVCVSETEPRDGSHSFWPECDGQR